MEEVWRTSQCSEQVIRTESMSEREQLQQLAQAMNARIFLGGLSVMTKGPIGRYSDES
jgi:hypothetical protein